MRAIDEILAKHKAFADELEIVKQEEHDAVLKNIKEKIKLFNFEAITINDILLAYKKQGTAEIRKHLLRLGRK